MKKKTIFIIVISLVIGLFISSFQVVSSAAPSLNNTPTVAPENVPQACLINLEKMVNDDMEPEGAENLPEADKEYALTTYQVSGNTISNPHNEKDIPADFVEYQNDTKNHERIWKFITDVIPADQRTMLGEFVIFSDGYDNVTGAVDQGAKEGTWTIEADAVDSQNFNILSTTLVHEFAHMLTLNDKQITDNTSTCDLYMTLDGCSQNNSYINTFYDAFWIDIYDEWKSDVKLSKDGEVDEDGVATFYEKYTDQFVTDYAPTGPEEDIAESWTYFVFNGKAKDDTIAKQKIEFFSTYPELVQLREKMLNGLCPYTEE